LGLVLGYLMAGQLTTAHFLLLVAVGADLPLELTVLTAQVLVVVVPTICHPHMQVALAVKLATN
jgi:hypothetical protein